MSVKTARNAVKASALAATLGLVLASCGLSSGDSSTTSDTDLSITMATSVDAGTLDPPNFSATTDTARMDLIYERLTLLEEDGTISPWLATSWEQTDDTTWVFELREGVEFTDGTAFDGEAVKTSLERAAEAPQGSGLLGVIESVDVLGDHEVQLNLSAPFSGILHNLSVAAAGIISPTAIAENEDGLAQEPVGTGAFMLDSWNIDESMTLVRNEDYWGETGNVQTLEIVVIPEASTRLSALQAGDVDIIENPPTSERETIEASDSMNILLAQKAQPVFLGFELENVPDLELRRAIAMAIDTDAIVNDVIEGIGEPADNGFLPPHLLTPPEDDPIAIEFDPEGARAIVESEGLEGTEISLTLPQEYYLRDAEIGEVIQSQLADVGITLNLVIQDGGTWYSTLLEHDTEMFYLGWGITAGDPADTLTRLFRSDAVNNHWGFSGLDEEIDQLASLEVQTDERNDLMNDIQRVLIEDQVAVIPLYQSVNYYATDASVDGFRTVRSVQWDFSDVTISE